MPRDKLKIVAPAADIAEHGGHALDGQIGFLLRLAMQRHTSIFSRLMIEGLTQSQFAALAKLQEVGPCSQNHLGRLIYLDAATIKGVVDRLCVRGFLTALHDQKDRRRRAVALTDRGRQVTAAAIKVAAEISAATLGPLTPEERCTVTRLLKTLSLSVPD
jgi:DNA-binding MarR family transcriptional regulator